MFKLVSKQDRLKPRDRINSDISRKTEIPIALVKEMEGYLTPIFNTVFTLAYGQTFLKIAIV